MNRIALLALAILLPTSAQAEDIVRAVLPLEFRPARAGTISQRPIKVAVQLSERVIPVIDGNLDDACWSDCAVLPLLNNSGPAGASLPTIAFVEFGTTTAYFAFICPLNESNLELSAPSTADGKPRVRDINVWRDESVEIFLDPGRSKTKYFHFIVNTANLQMDGDARNTAWNGEWKSATVVVDQPGAALPKQLLSRAELAPYANAARYWTAEFAIPYATLGGERPNPADVWGLNFARNDKRGRKLHRWARIEKSNHEPEHFGELRFVPDLPSLKIGASWSTGDVKLGSNAFEVSIDSPTTVIDGLTAEAHLTTPTGKTEKFNGEVHKNSIAFKIPIAMPGEHKLKIVAMEKSGRAKDDADFVLDVIKPASPLAVKLVQRQYYAGDKMLAATITRSENDSAAADYVLSTRGETLRQGAVKIGGHSIVEFNIANLLTGTYKISFTVGTNTVSNTFDIIPSPFLAE